MNRLTIYQRLLVGFGLLLLQLLIIAGIAMYSMANTSSRLGTINDDIAPQVEAANKMSQAVGQALSAVGNIGIVTGAADVEREYGLLKTAYTSYETHAKALAGRAQGSSFAPLLQQQEQSYKAATAYYRGTLEKIGAYKRHLLVCTGPRCTPDGASQDLFDSLGDKFKAAGLNEGELRVKRSRVGCFAACKGGPVMCVQPDGTWYYNVTPENLDRIVAQHLVGGKVVEDLVFHQGPSLE